jgi:hypothetical protein
LSKITGLLDFSGEHCGTGFDIIGLLGPPGPSGQSGPLEKVKSRSKFTITTEGSIGSFASKAIDPS